MKSFVRDSFILLSRKLIAHTSKKITDKAINKLAGFISTRLLLLVSARLLFAGGGLWGLLASKILLELARKLVIPAAHKTAFFAAHRIVIPTGKKSIRFISGKIVDLKQARTAKIGEKKLATAHLKQMRRLQALKGKQHVS